ncbi:MAG: terpene cyclase/mutase family protein, partial [Candidatus Gribaldobacteria bacterium]|nr:terpene cyclase/mutase family protein [Candidatus Gribaldobacteria bacterium]
MNTKIKQFGVGVLAVCTMSASFGSPVMTWAEGSQNSLLTVLEPSNSAKPLVLDLKDGLDAQKLIGEQSLGEGKQTSALSAPEAKVKSFSQKTLEKSGFETSGFAVSSVITNPIITGISWLKNNQNTPGSWGQNSRTALVDTATVLSAFHCIAEPTSSVAYQNALDWFNLTYPENSGYLAEKTIALAQAGQDVVSLSEFLAGQINEKDFGFGYQRNYQSDITITAKALKAVTASNYIDPGSDATYTLRSTLYYLLLSQNPDGGWPKTRGGQSDVKTTVLVLEAFQPYQDFVLGGTPQGEIIIQTKIDLGLNYLKNTQSVNGSWQDIEGTAQVYNIMLNYGQYPNYNQAALDYLTSSQSADGSFSENSYLTATALKTIAKPDMAITNIQNISATLPNQPATVEITIANLGYFKSQPINFRVEPHALHLTVDGKEIPLQYEAGNPESIIFEENSTIALQVILLNLAYGAHTVKFSVDYVGAEFDKTNNQKSASLMFDNPVFTGPEPPTWAGAQTSALANKITTVWKPSNNPATTHYYLFLGPSAGNYTQYFDIPSA